MTHEYPDAPEYNADNVNRVVDSLNALKSTLAQVENYARDLAARISR